MTARGITALVLGLAALMSHAPASAQEASEVEAPGAEELGIPDPPAGYDASTPRDCVGPSCAEAASVEKNRWPEARLGGPIGVRNPTRGSHMDRGLVMAGAIVASSAYVSGVAFTIPFILLGGCWGPFGCNRDLAGLSALPLATWAGGFAGTSSAFIAYITGGIFSVVEAIGVIMLLVGAMHHHPTLVPGSAGSARMSAQGLEITF